MLLMACLLFSVMCVSAFAEDAAPFRGREDAAVFTGPPAALAPRLRYNVPGSGGPLRVLTVEERVGAAREGVLVRVPLFFHTGECPDPNRLQVLESINGKTGQPIPYQADDVRSDPAGGISRMHIYFEVNLAPWERKFFHLVQGDNPGQRLPLMPLNAEGDRVTLTGDALKLTFWTAGERAGAIAAIQAAAGKVSLPDSLLAPRLLLVRQAGDCQVIRKTPASYAEPASLEIRDMRWAAGPLFSKLVVRFGPKGLPDNAEFTYLLPRRDSEFIQTQRLFPSDPNTPDVVGAGDNTLLAGRMILGSAAEKQTVVRVPAGLRRLTRSTHGHSNAALVNAEDKLSLLPIPYVQTGMRGIEISKDGTVLFNGTGDFRRTPDGNSGTLRAFWGQVAFVFSNAVDEESLWEVSRAHFQPLTAVVDEPGLSSFDLTTELAVLMTQFRIDGRNWTQIMYQLYAQHRDEELKNYIKAGNWADLESEDWWLQGARGARASLMRNRTQPIRENEKGSPASGPLDSYSLTYDLCGIAPLSRFAVPSPRLDAICAAASRASRAFNGKTDDTGFPWIDCFYSAQNQQCGAYLMGMYTGKTREDADLLRFYRDCARTAAVLDIYGHGQRAYTGRALGWGNSDLLYESLADMWLRATELISNEDLWLHPAVYGRYFDCVDVNADLCHRTLGDPGMFAPSWWRANMFRGQCHDHRWELWATAPYLGLFANAADGGYIGLTEACYYTRRVESCFIGWCDIIMYFMVDIAFREGIRNYQPEPAPPLPADVTVARVDGQNQVAWKAVPRDDIAGYRIYRADKMGGPWTFLNSPHREQPGQLATGTTFTDAAGKEGQVYFVTAIDSRGRESRWFPDEPFPKPSHK